MILSMAVALVLSQSSVKKVEIIRGTSKKAVKTETSLTAGPSAEQKAREQEIDAKSIELNAKSDELNAKSDELNQRADELKAKDAANEAKAQQDAKAKAAQQKILEKHARDLQAEYEKAANALAGE